MLLIETVLRSYGLKPEALWTLTMLAMTGASSARGTMIWVLTSREAVQGSRDGKAYFAGQGTKEVRLRTTPQAISTAPIVLRCSPTCPLPLTLHALP